MGHYDELKQVWISGEKLLTLGASHVLPKTNTEGELAPASAAGLLEPHVSSLKSLRIGYLKQLLVKQHHLTVDYSRKMLREKDLDATPPEQVLL